MPSINQTLAQIEEQYGPRVARAFEEAIADIVNSVTLSRLEAAIRNGDIEGAIRLLNIDNAVFSGLQQQLMAAYNEAAVATIAAQTWRAPDQTSVVIRWDIQNPRAVQWAADLSGQKITEITEDIRAVARSVISEGVELGRGPRQTALDLVGRTQANGQRVGGVIGLTGQQEGYVANMRARLASGDPAEMSKVFNMTKRDRRFDRIINRAIEAGKPVSASDINKLTERYRARLLKYRADTIARTETLNSVATARFDAFREGMSGAGIPDWAVRKRWRHGGGGMKPRDQHVAMAGVTVQGINTAFVMRDGARLLHPHDGSLGAGARHLANCTCTYDIDVDYAGLFRAGIS